MKWGKYDYRESYGDRAAKTDEVTEVEKKMDIDTMTEVEEGEVEEVPEVDMKK